MAYLQFSAYHLPVLDVHQCWINLGFMVFLQQKRHATNHDVAQKYVKMYCDTNKLPKSPFFGSHPKHHGSRGLSKHYHLRFDTKLGHGIFAILRIPCACIGCTSILYKPYIYGLDYTSSTSCAITNFQ